MCFVSKGRALSVRSVSRDYKIAEAKITKSAHVRKEQTTQNNLGRLAKTILLQKRRSFCKIKKALCTQPCCTLQISTIKEISNQRSDFCCQTQG